MAADIDNKRRSDKQNVLCDSFNLQNDKNRTVFLLHSYAKITYHLYRASFSPMISGEVFCLYNIGTKISPMIISKLNLAGGNPALDYSIPSRGTVEILLVASCHGNRDKLRSDGPLDTPVNYKVFIH